MRNAALVLSIAIGFAAAPTSARNLASFGRCLEREGAVFYGTSWCPQCDAQRRVLGSAMRHVPYVECSVDGGRRSTAECDEADIHAYPTWEFGDGTREAGRKSLEALASRTGCALDDASDAD
jgi:hypothetical protein